MEYSKIIFSSLFSIIPQVAIVFICFRYYFATKTNNSIFFLLGAFLSLLKIIFAPISFYLTINMVFEPLTMGLIGGTFNILGLIGAFFFAFAFRSFIKKMVTVTLGTDDDIINEIGKS